MKNRKSIYCFIIFSTFFSCGIFENEYGYFDSNTLFDDTEVHEFRIHFYTEHWKDSLEYYYSISDTDLYLPAQLIYGNNKIILDSVGVRFKGFSSFHGAPFPKKPYKIDFNVFKDHKFFDIDKLNFSNGYKDPSFLREKIAYDIIRDYIPAPRAAFAYLYLKWKDADDISDDSSCIGLYTMVEQVEGGFLRRNFGANYGNLFKAEMSNMRYWGEDKSVYKGRIYSLKTNEITDDWSDLFKMLKVLNTTPDSLFESRIYTYLHIDRCIVYLAFNMVLSNFDSYICSGRNFYLYHNPFNELFSIIPWDLNMAFGTYKRNGWDPIIQDIDSTANLGLKILHKRVLANRDLKGKYLDIIEKLIKGPCSYASISHRTEELLGRIDRYVKNDRYKLYSYDEFKTNIESDIMDSTDVIPGLISFTKLRTENIKKQLSESYGRNQ